MSLFVDEGKKAVLKAMTADLPDAVIKIRLYKALSGTAGDDAGHILSDFTEADFAGYAALTGSVFGAPSINGSSEGETDSTLLTWTRSSTGSPQTILGIYITWHLTSGGDKLIFMHHFAASVTLVNAGEVIEKYVNLFDANLVP